MNHEKHFNLSSVVRRNDSLVFVYSLKIRFYKQNVLYLALRPNQGQSVPIAYRIGSLKGA